ncbi:hypothetical protein D3C85_1674190 [compost metagenome]
MGFVIGVPRRAPAGMRRAQFGLPEGISLGGNRVNLLAPYQAVVPAQPRQGCVWNAVVAL